MPFDERLNQSEITIRVEHLHPDLQKIISDGLGAVLEGKDPGIRVQRRTRAAYDFNAFGGAVAGIVGKGYPRLGGVGLFAATAYLRTVAAIGIQIKHEELTEEMHKRPVIQTKFEGDYPEDWVKAGAIAETHPIFYVDGKGNLHFLKNNRMEYARHKFQQTTFGKLGLNLWRWRAYLKPPEAPQKVREWAAIKVRKWIKREKPAYQAYAKISMATRNRIQHGRFAIKAQRKFKTNPI